jgi:glucokinase
LKALAIDLGGSHATCAIVEDRTILASEEIAADSEENLSALLGRTLEVFRRLGNKERMSPHDCDGIAVGFPGLVSTHTGRVLSTNAKYEDAPQLDLAAWSRENLGLPLRIENDARMALLGEAYAGAASGFSEVVMLTLGTGIGGVAMMEGKLLRGKHSQAGCLGGHIPVLFSGRPCTCGGMGCAEAEAGGWSLPLIFEEWPGAAASSMAKYSKLGFKELFEEAATGDRVAVEIRDRCLKVWCATAVAMVHAYDPEIIVMGGGVMKSADGIVPVIQSHVQQYAWTPWGKVRVRAATLGNHAALLGAVPLLSDTTASPRSLF